MVENAPYSPGTFHEKTKNVCGKFIEIVLNAMVSRLKTILMSALVLLYYLKMMVLFNAIKNGLLITLIY